MKSKCFENKVLFKVERDLKVKCIPRRGGGFTITLFVREQAQGLFETQVLYAGRSEATAFTPGGRRPPPVNFRCRAFFFVICDLHWCFALKRVIKVKSIGKEKGG